MKLFETRLRPIWNVFSEEVYYRVYATYSANGILFTLKHFYQRWLFPEILVGEKFVFAAVAYNSLYDQHRTGSVFNNALGNTADQHMPWAAVADLTDNN